jgi:hypothetical protein
MYPRLLAVFVLLSALSGPGPVLAFGSCESEAYMQRFDERLPASSCRTVHTTAIRWSGGSAPLRVIIPGGDAATPDDSLFIERVDELVRRVGTAMDQMRGLELGNVSILLSNLVDHDYHAVATSPTGECHITFYKPSGLPTVDEFQFTMSHELFHCMQYATWPAIPGGEGAVWWSEGTADYFGHLANPGSTAADGYLTAFDQDSHRASLADMEYQSQVYFLWLGQTQGATAVRDFIGEMARTTDRAAQIAAMNRSIPMDTWIAFSQDYGDRRIRLPGGRALPGTVSSRGTTVIDGPTSVTFITGAYVLVRQKLQFKKGRTYTLAVSEGSGAFRSRFDQAAGEWTDPPERILACDEDRIHKVLSLAIERDSITYRIDVEESERIDERACCLVGSWKPTEAAMRSEPDMALANTQSVLASHGVEMQCGVNGGGWTLEFSPNGTGSVKWRGFSYRCVARESGGALANTFIRNGHTGFNWTILDRGVGRADYTENTLAWTHEMQFGPRLTTRVLPDAGASTPANDFSFTCTDTSLKIQGVYGLNHEQGEYTRIGPPPR